MKHEDDLEDLIDRHLHGELTEAEMERLAELLDSNPSARQNLVLAEAARGFFGQLGLRGPARLIQPPPLLFSFRGSLEKIRWTPALQSRYFEN